MPGTSGTPGTSGSPGWTCASQGRPQNAPYPLSGNTCTCPSFASGDYVITGANGRHTVYCKHRLAFLAYRDILLAHLHERLVGDARDGNEREHARAQPHCRLILESAGREPIVSAYMERGRAPYPICWVRRVQRTDDNDDLRVTFAADPDMAAFAHWLATNARPLPGRDNQASDEAAHIYHHAIARGVPPDEAAFMADAALVDNPTDLDLLYEPIGSDLGKTAAQASARGCIHLRRAE